MKHWISAFMKSHNLELRAPPSRESKPSPQASALKLVQPFAALRPFRFASLRYFSLQGWANPLGLTLATPDLAGQSGVAVRNFKSQFQKGTNPYEYQSRHSLRLYREGGENLRYPKRPQLDPTLCRHHQALQDAQDQWQEKTQWHTCVAYGPAAGYAARIPTGAHVFIEGELVHREYDRTVETDSGPVKVQWPLTEVVIDSISLLDRKEKQEKEGAA